MSATIRHLSLAMALRPLRHRDYRLLWSGLAISLVGNGLWHVALAWQIIALGGGPAELSLVTTLYGIGLLACVLLGGIAADRLPQRSIMLAADVARTIVLLAVGVLSLTGALQMWHLALAGLVIGAGEAFFFPSYTALLPRLLPEEDLLPANGLEGTLRPLTAEALGPALGGVLVAATSPGAAILVNAATFVVSALCLLGLRVKGPTRSTSGTHSQISILGDLRAGVRYVRTTSWLWSTLLFAMAFVLILLGPLHVLLPFAVRDRVGGGAVEYGLVLAAFGIGGAAGALLISSRSLPRRYLTAMLLLWGPGQLPFALFGLADSLLVMSAAAFTVGATGSAALVIWGTLLQRRVPDGLRGRVSSLDIFVSLTLMPVSMAFAGPAGDHFGITTIFLIAGIAPTFGAILAILLPRLDRDELTHPLDRPALIAAATT